MKFFLDSANLSELKSAVELGIIDGVTTNPSLIAKEGVPVEEQVRKICDIVDGDVSAEVVSTSAKEMIAEGRRLAKIHKNIVVKVPLIPEGIKAVGALAQDGVRTNVTLCFSAAQALVAAKAGAYIISPFVGRVDDIGWPGIELIDNIMKIYGNYNYQTQVLAASVRGPLHVIEVAKSGVHIVTLAYKVLEQLFHHPLTDKGLEQFLSDHRKAFEMVNV
jgi:transaldolase